MLPLPGSTRPSKGGPRIFFPPPPTPTSRRFDLPVFLSSLRTRSRLTNLTVSLLLSALTVSLLLNFHYLNPVASGPKSAPWRARVQLQAGWDDAASLQQHEAGIPLSMETTIDRDKRFSQLDHLVMVPGHAIWIGRDRELVGDDDQWVLQPMQKGGSVRTFRKHIEEGVREMREDPSALLVFSGGATRAFPAPPLTEGYSYHFLATTLGLLPSDPFPANATGHAPLPLNQRAVTEDYALDSYTNLLFAVARFKEVTGRYPLRVTVVGYEMKRRRFTELHRAAIGLPLDTWKYTGINDEGDTREQYAGELKYGYTPFLSSPSGCRPPLSIKRVNRNPFFRYHPYHTSCPELAELLEWCPPTKGQVDEASQMQTFEGALPWRGKAQLGLEWTRERW